ncbi:MAG: SPFH domain-containing protein [Coriobacteriia bacterium]|nr:SPFH domain-containing protein [Coriobacteriia bacterium]
MDVRIQQERILRPLNGVVMLIVIIAGFIVSTVTLVYGIILLDSSNSATGGLVFTLSMVAWLVLSLLCPGLKILRPNEARVFTLLGRYYGTLKTAGYYFVNPLCVSFSPDYNAAKAASLKKMKDVKAQGGIDMETPRVPKTVSLKTQTLDNGLQKVNDVLGNPIIIGAIVIWRIENPTQAVFAVENYHDYLGIQTDSTIRNTARLYPYDVFSEDENDEGIREKTLRGSAQEIAETMETELRKRVADAGLSIVEVRITHLAYAEEIAAAMLQRQQASAIIAARQKIVDGAVGMVKMAIDKLSEDSIVLLDEERKAAMVSNLLVVLCGNRDASPIVNTGSIF